MSIRAPEARRRRRGIDAPGTFSRHPLRTGAHDDGDFVGLIPPPRSTVTRALFAVALWVLELGGTVADTLAGRPRQPR